MAASTEIHHRSPQCLLRMRDRAVVADLDGASIEAWLEYEAECLRVGIDPDVGREELSALIDASTVELSRDDHRALLETDFVRWGAGAGCRRFDATGVSGSGCSRDGATGASHIRNSRRPRPSFPGRCSLPSGSGCGGYHSAASGPAGSGCRGPTTAPHLARRSRGAGVHHQLPRLASPSLPGGSAGALWTQDSR
jgi:hypothetical protein